MSDIKTNIPLPVAPLTGPDGRVNEVWWRFFLDIFNRTGGGTGNDGTVDPVYPDISISLPLDTQNVPLPDVSLPFSANASQEISPFDALFVPTVQEAPLLEMTTGIPFVETPLIEQTYAPIMAENTNVSFISITYSGQLVSTVATGTAPMVVSSTTKVTNLNADLLDGADWAAPAAIGSTTPNTGSFTTLTATGLISSAIGFRRSAAVATAGYLVSQLDSLSNANGLFWDGSKCQLTNSGSIIASIESGGFTVNSGILKLTGGTLLQTSANLTNGAGASTATFTNSPVAGNPTKWIPINDNGTTRYIPAF